MMQLKCMGVESYFWRTKADAEMDFISDYVGLLLPIEVKSADNTKAKSLHMFCNRYRPKMAIKTSLKNVGDNMGRKHAKMSIFSRKARLYQLMQDKIKILFICHGNNVRF